MAKSDSKREYDNQYHREKMRQLNVRLHAVYDADLIEIYEGIPNKADFLRDAIRRYAEENNIKTEE